MFQPSIRLIHEPADAVADAYWITHAGGGTNTLMHRMRTVDTSIAARVWSPWMPAREEMADVCFEGDLNEMASLLGQHIAAERQREGRKTPFAMIGHSFGSVLAYRIVCELVARDCSPHRLVVLSYPAPDTASHDQPLHELSDEALIREVDRLFGGIPEHIRDDVHAQQYFVPGLRLDLGLLESYQHAKTKPLAVPIVAICGTEDGAVDVAQVNGWQRMTSDAFRLRLMPGDHFFPLARMPEILQVALWDVLPT